MITIRPLSKHGLAADFLETYKKAIKSTVYYEKTTPSRVLFLRPSQMPFCAMNFFINYSTKGLYRQQTFASAFYTTVGTAVHTVMQNFLCQSGKFLADYHCMECGTWHRRSYKYECCDFPTQYHEIEIDYKGIKGHIDAIYKDKNGKLWIVDFKTTSIKQAPNKKKDPGITYREQIEIYAVLVELQYGIKIEGYADEFILRDNPMATDPVMWCRPLTDETRSAVKRKLSRYKKMHRAVLDANSKQEVLELFDWGRCKDPYCQICMEKSDRKVKEKLVDAYLMGKKRKNLPVRELAEREQQRQDDLRKKQSTRK